MMRSSTILFAALLVCTGCSDDGGSDDGGGVMFPQQQPGAGQAPMTPVDTTPTNMTPTAPMTPTDAQQPPAMQPPVMDMPPAMMEPVDTGGMMAMDPPMMMAAPLSISSPEFTDGAMIPARFRCDAPSPALAIGGGPDGTMSYAIVMTDLGLNLLHWVIYDIPADTTMLAEGVPEGAAPATPAGSKQAPIDTLVSFTAGTGSERFVGPCGGLSDYEFKLYAISEAAFSGASAGATGSQVKSALEAAALETTTLTISSMP